MISSMTFEQALQWQRAAARLCLCLVAVSAFVFAQHKVAWCEVDISTDKPLELRGQMYKRISKGILDPTTATILVVDSNEDFVIFISLDSIVAGSIKTYVNRKIRQLRPGFPTGKLLYSATHTHTAINVDAKASKEYANWLVDTLTNKILETYDNRKEGATFAYGYGYARIGLCRRPTYFDDLRLRKNARNNALSVDKHAKMHGNTNDPQFAGIESGADSIVNLLYVFHDGKLTGAIVNIPCPAQATDGLLYLSADFWHETRQLIRKEHGDIFILPQCAAAGELVTRDLINGRLVATRRKSLFEVNVSEPKYNKAARLDAATQIAFAFNDTLKWARLEPIRDPVIKHVTLELKLKPVHVDEELLNLAKKEIDECGKLLENPPKDQKQADIIASRLGRARTLVRKAENEAKGIPYTTYANVLRFGDIAFASNQFELYGEYQFQIQAQSPAIQTFVVQLSGHGTYLPSPKAFNNQGYGAIPFSCSVGPEGGAQLVNATVNALQKLFKE